ncbi:universal stress protein [Carnobacterium gallinarum]|uniref:universal stress protein n=1 Tax=Carnobacterium gallinarum TaxID=2749 RepID=UPI0005554C85|nr:universal stress protein [Carnobacterium gallinarum]
MEQQYKQILVGVDGSVESETAFRKALQIAKRNQASLLLVHVVDTLGFQSISDYEGLITDNVMDQVKEKMDEYSIFAERMGVENVTALIMNGSPKLLLAKEIPAEHQTDLILLGATGLNAVERLFMGSVSQYIIQNASCDVLIVRTDLENQAITHQENWK